MLNGETSSTVIKSLRVLRSKPRRSGALSEICLNAETSLRRMYTRNSPTALAYAREYFPFQAPDNCPAWNRDPLPFLV
jgi:hypothetical protein